MSRDPETDGSRHACDTHACVKTAPISAANFCISGAALDVTDGAGVTEESHC